MQVELKSLHSPDVRDLENFTPKISNNFSFLLQLMIGPQGKEGEESFDVEICTPMWLKTNYKSDDIVIGRHQIIIQKYDYDRLVQFINKYLTSCTGETWSDIVPKLSRLGRWEFEDYIE